MAPGALVIVTVSAAPTIGGISGKSARTSPPMKPSVRSRTLNGSMALLIVGLSTPLRNARSCSLIGSTFERSVIHCPHRSWKTVRRCAVPAFSRDLRFPGGEVAGRLLTLPSQELVDRNRASGRGIERVNPATHRQGQQQVAVLAQIRSQAGAFGPDNEHRRRRNFGRIDVARAGTAVQTGDPATAPLQCLQRASQVRDGGNAQVLDSA